MLTARQLTIFKSIVEEFISTNEPVGSKTLMEKYQLPYSSATIRNEMSFLEDYGYLEKTHTSSGRIPSIEGYRFYVDHLVENRIEDKVKMQLQTLFHDRHRSLNDIVQDSCKMLSELTNLTSVVLGPDSGYECLQRMTVVPLSNTNVTVIIVTDKGHVENKTFTLEKDYTMDDLMSCVNVMNDLLVGTPINEVVGRLEHEVKPILATRVHEHEVLFNAFLEAFIKFAKSNIYFSGKENMLYQPEYNDVNKLRQLVSAFENLTMWNTLESVGDSDGVVVKIGNESPLSGLSDVSVISAPFKTGKATHGSIAVIGPTRMPYEKVVSLVEYISKNIEEIFMENEEE